MKKISHKAKQNTMLLTSASSLVLLAGCDFTSMNNPFTTDRPPQVVEGERRQPIYNQQMIQRMQKQTGAPIYSNAAKVPQPPAEMQAPQDLSEPAPPPIVAGETVEMAPPPSPDAFTTAVKSNKNRRPAAPREEYVEAPAPKPSEVATTSRFITDEKPSDFKNPPPWKMREGVQDDYVEESGGNTTARAQRMPDPEESVQPARVQTQEKAPEWADQWIGKKAPQPDANMEAERSADYPTFSSVPDRPANMEAAKASAKQNLQELQDAQGNAASGRASLSSEPSQQFKSTPVEMPVPQTQGYVTPAEVNPQEPAANQSAEPQAPVIATPSEATPGSPRRGIDIMTQEEWEALKRANGVAPAPAAEPQPHAPYDQRGALETPALPHMLLSAVITQDNATAPSSSDQQESSSFFANLFDSFKDFTETDSATHLPSPSQLRSKPVVVGMQTQPTQQLQTKAEQLWLLPPSTVAAAKPAPNVVQKTDPEDWLLALVSQTKERPSDQSDQLMDEAKNTAQEEQERLASFEKQTANQSPETQLLAQLGGPITSQEAQEQAQAQETQNTKPKELASLDSAFAKIAPNTEAQSQPMEASAPSSKQSLAPIQFAKVTPGNPIPEVKPATQTIEAVQPTAAAETPAEQPDWMSQLFTQKLEPAKAPQSKAIFGTELATAYSEPSAPKALAEITPDARPSLPKAATLVQTQPEKPVVNRAIAELNARMAAEKEVKLAKKSKGKTHTETTLAKKVKSEPTNVAKATPVAAPTSAPQLLLEDQASLQQAQNAPVTIWQKAEEEKKETVTSLPTAPDHLQAALAPAEPQQEQNQPEWFNKMLNPKEGASDNQQQASTAVNDSNPEQKTTNTAQNSSSQGEASAPEEINTQSASSEESVKLPSLSGIAAPIASIMSSDATGLAASAASSLPSPKILQQIKMMPAPSYSARVRPGTLQ